MKIISTNIFSLLLMLVFSNSNAQTISPELVGTNAWYTNPTDQVWGLTKECGVKMVRIGGHAFDVTVPSNAYLMSWVKKIRAMGAEPIIQVSQYNDANGAKAAALVHYFNVEQTEVAPIKYWNLGNEPWLQNSNLSSATDVGTMVETYFKPISIAMKEVDPTIKIYGPDFCYYVEGAINDLFGGKNDIAGKIPGKDYYYCDGISWHKYPQADNINLAIQGIEDFRISIVKCKAKVDAVNTAYGRTGDNALIWGIGEYNAKGGSVVHSWENGQMFGGVLGLCMKYEAKYATSWSMFEHDGDRTGTDFSFIDGTNMYPRSSYRHMQFVANYFHGEYIDGVTNSSDFIVYGAQEGSKLAVMIMHRGVGASKEYKLRLDNTVATGGDYHLNVNGGIDQEYSDIISPRATQVLIFEGTTVTKINYTSEDFDNERAPVYSTFETSSVLPASPSDLNATPESYKEIKINWTDNSDNEQGFILERKGVNGYEVISILSPNVTTYTDYNLSPQTSYSYRLRSYNSIGKSEYTAVAEATTGQAPLPKAFNGPHSIPGKIEVEDFDDNESGIAYFDADAENKGGKYRATGVDIQDCTQGGYNVGYVNEGEWLTYLVENVTAGTYDLVFQLASASTTTETKKIEVYIDDNLVGGVTPIITGGWQTWQTVTLNDVEILNSLPLQLSLKFLGSGYNLNWMDFSVFNSIKKNELNENIDVFYSIQNKLITISSDFPFHQSEVRITNSMGQILFSSVFPNLDKIQIKTENWHKGVYLVLISNNLGNFSSKLMVN